MSAKTAKSAKQPAKVEAKPEPAPVDEKTQSKEALRSEFKFQPVRVNMILNKSGLNKTACAKIAESKKVLSDLRSAEKALVDGKVTDAEGNEVALTKEKKSELEATVKSLKPKEKETETVIKQMKSVKRRFNKDVFKDFAILMNEVCREIIVYTAKIAKGHGHDMLNVRYTKQGDWKSGILLHPLFVNLESWEKWESFLNDTRISTKNKDAPRTETENDELVKSLMTKIKEIFKHEKSLNPVFSEKMKINKNLTLALSELCVEFCQNLAKRIDSFLQFQEVKTLSRDQARFLVKDQLITLTPTTFKESFTEEIEKKKGKDGVETEEKITKRHPEYHNKHFDYVESLMNYGTSCGEGEKCPALFTPELPAEEKPAEEKPAKKAPKTEKKPKAEAKTEAKVEAKPESPKTPKAEKKTKSPKPKAEKKPKNK